MLVGQTDTVPGMVCDASRPNPGQEREVELRARRVELVRLGRS